MAEKHIHRLGEAKVGDTIKVSLDRGQGNYKLIL